MRIENFIKRMILKGTERLSRITHSATNKVIGDKIGTASFLNYSSRK